jgi:NAD(P)-dependent dehydrogenase (short-subunit alcohol dehydrogenase family)
MADVTIVTGAGRGMGLACAERLSAHPGELVVVDLDEASVTAVADRLDAKSFVCDVADAGSVADLAAFVAGLGTFRRLAHVAGISPTMADAMRIWNVDLRGSALMLDAFTPLVVPGSVAVCFASIAAPMVAGAGDATIDAIADDPLAPDFIERLIALDDPRVSDSAMAYGWAKRGVQRLVRRAAVAWGPLGGRVVSVSPGMIATPQGAQEFEEQPMMKVMLDLSPVGRMGEPGELAALVDWLMSEEAWFITGSDVVADGGVMAGLGM